MTSTADEFRSHGRKEITLPSGLSVEIGRVEALDFVGVGEIPLPMAQDLSHKKDLGLEDTKKINEEFRLYGIRAITAGSRKPRFSDRAEDTERDNVVHVDDLDPKDFSALAEAIFVFSGITEGLAAAANSFRDHELGENGGRVSGEISPTADRNSTTEPRHALSEHDDCIPGATKKKETS